MRADPKPHDIVVDAYAKRSIMQTDAHRPKSTDRLEAERGVRGIAF
jgi:hypothetical protein